MRLRWKMTIPIIVAIAIGVIAAIFVAGIKTRQIVIEEAKTSVLTGYRDIILNSLLTMMTSANYKESKGRYLEQVKHIGDIKIIRSDALDKNDRSNTDSYVKDDMEKEVIANKTDKVEVAGNDIRGIYPFIARKDLMGKNCLSCHNVKEGDILGAVSIKVPLKGSFDGIRSAQSLYALLGIIGIVGLAIIVITAYKITHKPFEDLMLRLEEIAAGDLSVSIGYSNKKDVIARIAKSINKMSQFFSIMLNNMLISVNNVVSAVDVLRLKAERSAEGAKNQSSQIVQVATAVEEMSQTITDISRNASVASDTSSEAMGIADKGKQVADGAVETVNRVYNSTIELATMVEKLNMRVSEIGGIVVVIKDIADQTNLLALNAAIEAARAGEQGMGFAVVANEVKKLAERTIKATAEIADKIGAVQAESSQTAKSMEDASDEVSKATEYIKQVCDSLNQIVGSVQKVRDQIIQIATAVDEQSVASEEVAKNTELTAFIAKEIEQISDDVMSEVNGLTMTAEALRNSSAGFKTKNSELMILEIAKTDHRIFLGKVASCLKGGTRLDPSQLPDHHSCRFGKWYEGKGKEVCGHLNGFKNIDMPHERIHALAKGAVSACNSGDRDKAQQTYREMEDLSGQIVSLLDGIKNECME